MMMSFSLHNPSFPICPSDNVTVSVITYFSADKSPNTIFINLNSMFI